jgi:hypothetical protein
MCQRSSYVPDCDCSDCMPEGADGAVEDALDAAQARVRFRGRYVVRPLARTVAVSWVGDGGSRRDVDQEALREAAHCLRRAGCSAVMVPGARELFAA